jgi:hypothetical protein
MTEQKELTLAHPPDASFPDRLDERPVVAPVLVGIFNREVANRGIKSELAPMYSAIRAASPERACARVRNSATSQSSMIAELFISRSCGM